MMSWQISPWENMAREQISPGAKFVLAGFTIKYQLTGNLMVDNFNLELGEISFFS